MKRGGGIEGRPSNKIKIRRFNLSFFFSPPITCTPFHWQNQKHQDSSARHNRQLPGAITHNKPAFLLQAFATAVTGRARSRCCLSALIRHAETRHLPDAQPAPRMSCCPHRPSKRVMEASAGVLSLLLQIWKRSQQGNREARWLISPQGFQDSSQFIASIKRDRNIKRHPFSVTVNALAEKGQVKAKLPLINLHCSED